MLSISVLLCNHINLHARLKKKGAQTSMQIEKDVIHIMCILIYANLNIHGTCTNLLDISKYMYVVFFCNPGSQYNIKCL